MNTIRKGTYADLCPFIHEFRTFFYSGITGRGTDYGAPFVKLCNIKFCIISLVNFG